MSWQRMLLGGLLISLLPGMAEAEEAISPAMFTVNNL